MTLTAWRIVKRKHAAAALSGDGARRYGGRWNRKGTAVIYTAQSISLAALEMLVHLSAADLLAEYVVLSVAFESRHVETPKRSALPRNWRDDPPPVEAQSFGSDWAAAARSVVLRVPSAIVETEFNYLINPGHPDFRQLRIGSPRPFGFDPRLAKG
jgi:RES domain-containing protein